MELSASFRYLPSPARIHIGPDALRQLGPEVERTGARRVFAVCGHSVAERTDLLLRVQNELGSRYAGVFSGVEAESPLPSVEEGVAVAREAGADLMLAIGGGSAVVTARAITILLAEEGSAQDLCTKYPAGRPPISPRLAKPKLPNIVLLTTPSTAANRAGAAVLDPVRRHRLELFDPKTRPAAILVDGGALLTAPARLFLNTATTTFCRNITALQSPRLSAFGLADLRQALDLGRTYMPRLCESAGDAEIRIQLAVAALLSNRAAESSDAGAGGVMTGLVHALQARYEQVAQGSAMSVLVAPAMRFNRGVLAEGQARVAHALGAGAEGSGNEELAGVAVEAVTAFLTALGMPQRLRDLEVPEDDLENIARDAMHDFFLRNNPRPVREPAELMNLLREVW